MNSINKHNLILNILQIIIDFSILTCLFYIFLFIHSPQIEKNFDSVIIFTQDHFKALVLILVSWLFISSYSKIYSKFSEERFIDFIRRFSSHIVGFSIILFAISGLKTENLYTNKESFYFLLILTSSSFLIKMILFYTLKFYQRTGRIVKERIIIIGVNNNSDYFLKTVKNQPQLGILVENHLTNPPSKDNFQSLYKILNNETHKNIDAIYLALGKKMNNEEVNNIIKIAEENFIKVKFIFDSLLENQYNLDISFVDTFPIFTYKKLPLDFLSNRVIKRIFDLTFTMMILCTILWWLLPLISIMVYFSQGRPILFKQKRNGLNGKEFNCLKFRTMKPHKFNDIKPTERDDPRVTKLGKILRKTSLDELPQFINVLKGEMSIVGPRPHMVSENESYSDIIKRYSLRHYVKPGITGLAQVKGYRGAIDSDKDMEMRIRTDIYYVRNWSFLLDLFIIYKTAKLMIFGDENAI